MSPVMAELGAPDLAYYVILTSCTCGLNKLEYFETMKRLVICWLWELIELIVLLLYDLYT